MVMRRTFQRPARPPRSLRVLREARPTRRPLDGARSTAAGTLRRASARRSGVPSTASATTLGRRADSTHARASSATPRSSCRRLRSASFSAQCPLSHQTFRSWQVGGGFVLELVALVLRPLLALAVLHLRDRLVPVLLVGLRDRAGRAVEGACAALIGMQSVSFLQALSTAIRSASSVLFASSRARRTRPACRASPAAGVRSCSRSGRCAAGGGGVSSRGGVAGGAASSGFGLRAAGDDDGCSRRNEEHHAPNSHSHLLLFHGA